MTENDEKSSASLMRLAIIVCVGVVIVSVLACVVLAIVRSDGLTQVKVTALDEKAEPRDHNLPLIKRNEALPDYKLTVLKSGGRSVDLGAKINKSAIDGLIWQLPSAIAVSDISSIRLDDQDKLVSDAIVEVQMTSDEVVSGNYRFEFSTERSFAAGLQSFFKTPLGIAITTAFTIAVVFIILSVFFGVISF